MKSTKDEALRALYEEFAENALEASDEEIVQELKDEGATVEAVAEHMRSVLRLTWKTHQQAALREARERYQREANTLKAKTWAVPTSAAARRQLLTGVLTSRPEAGLALSAQFRDFNEMTDEDVESWLQQFGHLGLLPVQSDKE
jgi:predicted transcriptional regulator